MKEDREGRRKKDFPMSVKWSVSIDFSLVSRYMWSA
jgi:hypothetical protein